MKRLATAQEHLSLAHTGREYYNSKVKKANADLTALKALPKLIPIPGLDIQRQCYLYDNIRSTVSPH